MKKNILLLTVLLFSSVVFSQKDEKEKEKPNKEPVKKEMDWYDAKSDIFNLIGFEWFEQDSLYRRLPVKSQWKITESVDDLANETAGGQLIFKTNSNRLYLNVLLQRVSDMHHMPPTGQSGFDLYVDQNGFKRYIKTTEFKYDTIQYEVDLRAGGENKMQKFVLNFPLYNGVEKLSVGVEKGSVIEKGEAFLNPGKVVIYGTSITQGGCVSRPGSAYPNYLSRTLDKQFVNLGFSGSGKGEPEMAHLINQIAGVDFIILDYEANIIKTYQETLDPFVAILRKKHPKTPILIMSKTRFAYDYEGGEGYEWLIKNRDSQKKMVEKLRKKGDNHIYFLDGSTVLGEDYFECTVDGVHPTDLGSYRIGKALLKEMHKIMGE